MAAAAAVAVEEKGGEPAGSGLAEENWGEVAALPGKAAAGAVVLAPGAARRWAREVILYCVLPRRQRNFAIRRVPLCMFAA